MFSYTFNISTFAFNGFVSFHTSSDSFSVKLDTCKVGITNKEGRNIRREEGHTTNGCYSPL